MSTWVYIRSVTKDEEVTYTEHLCWDPARFILACIDSMNAVGGTARAVSKADYVSATQPRREHHG